MKNTGAFVIVLICTLLIAGCTTQSSRTGQTPVPTSPVAVTTSGSFSVVSTPTPVYTAGGSTMASAGLLRVSVLDVGQGDSILVQSPAGRTMLVDAGDADAGTTVVSDLQSRGIASIDVAVASHAHSDHIGGYQAVLSAFPIPRFYDSGYPSTSSTYERMLTTIDQKNIKFIIPTSGKTIDLDPAITIDVLSPDGSNQGEIHDNMLVLRLSYDNTSFLLAGDMPETLETKISSSLQPTTILKVGHHGSNTSSSESFLSIIRPEVAIISVGAGNSYGHPTTGALNRLQAVGAEVYRSDLSGTITVITDGNTYQVTTEKTDSSGASLPVVTATWQQNSVPAGSAPVSPESGTVSITRLDLKAETVTIANIGESPVDLSGWKLTDEGAKNTYIFASTTVPVGESITITSGAGSGDLKWTSTNVWNNDGDTAFLYDGSGRLVDQKRG